MPSNNVIDLNAERKKRQVHPLDYPWDTTPLNEKMMNAVHDADNWYHERETLWKKDTTDEEVG